MIRCYFHMNNGQLSSLSCPGVGFFAAYSGNKGKHRNNPDSIAIAKRGPLPPGNYYIVVRSRGNLKNRTSNWMKSIRSGSDRDLCFALLREDERIDDTTFINKVERGSFRLHPAGSSGNSDGCITLVSLNDYMVLWRALVRTPSTMINPQLRAFGTIQVY